MSKYAGEIATAFLGAFASSVAFFLLSKLKYWMGPFFFMLFLDRKTRAIISETIETRTRLLRAYGTAEGCFWYEIEDATARPRGELDADEFARLQSATRRASRIGLFDFLNASAWDERNKEYPNEYYRAAPDAKRRLRLWTLCERFGK